MTSKILIEEAIELMIGEPFLAAHKEGTQPNFFSCKSVRTFRNTLRNILGNIKLYISCQSKKERLAQANADKKCKMEECKIITDISL